jgi:hypothetical protein
MAALNRKNQKIFAIDAGATGVSEFGSTAGGSTQYSFDPDDIQTADWLLGWLPAVLAGSKRLPTYEDFNAVFYTLSYQIAYGFQEGIAEYDTETEYRANSLVKKTGTVEIYRSLINSNTGNPLTDTDSWVLCFDFADVKSNQNVVINGAFNIWQRATSFTSIANQAYFADRFKYVKSGAMVHDISRSTDVPTVAEAGRLFNYSALIDCTTPDASIGASDVCGVSQVVEGYNFLPLAQKVITISFWVKATKAGVYCVSLANSIADRSIVKEYTIDAANTWERKTLTFAASPSAGTWNYIDGAGLQIFFTLAAGSNYQGAADSWQSANLLATSNQVNGCDSASNNFRICGVQLESGNIATPFNSITIQEELQLCLRYYERYLDIVADNIAIGFCQGAGRAYIVVPWQVEKRTTPTCSISRFAGFYPFNAAGAAQPAFSAGSFHGSNKMFFADLQGSSGLVSGNAAVVGLVANTDYFDGDSEL